MTFSEKLFAKLAEVEISQSELARRSGVPQSTVSAYMLGTNKPSWAHVQALAKALGITCNELTDDDPPAPARALGKRK